MNHIIKDLRFALRNLHKRPGFAAIVILVLGLGIGSTTAIFSIADALLLRSLPYPNPERLVFLREVGPKGNQMAVTAPNFRDLQTLTHSFEHLGVAAGSFPLVVTSAGSASRTRISYVSSEFFSVMGVQPLAGRTFVREEEKFGGPISTILSYGYWQKTFGGTPDFARLKLNVDGVACNVVGVMPPGFDYPAKT
jgi:putative ABC transport system permease protein